MPTTSLGLRYPSSTDDVRPYEDIQFLAEDVDDLLTPANIPGARIATASATADSGTITTTETVILTVNASLVSGRVYRVSVRTRVGTTVANDQAIIRVRENNLAGTEILGDTTTELTTQANGNLYASEVEYTAVSTGSKTFVATLVRTTGSGNLRMEALNTRPSYLYVDYIR